MLKERARERIANVKKLVSILSTCFRSVVKHCFGIYPHILANYYKNYLTNITTLLKKFL